MNNGVERGSYAQSEVQLDENRWQVARGIVRISYDFPNMYVVEGSEKCAIIDSGWGDEEEVQGVIEEVSATKKPLELMVVTHLHPDHDGGIPKLREVFPEASIIGLGKNPEDNVRVADLGGRSLTIFGSPGHTKDSKYVFDSAARAIFTGDNILGDLTGDVKYMDEYMHGLGSLITLNPNVICPGHYESVYDATPAVLRVLRHREEREKQVIQLLRPDEEVSIDRLFDNIYGKVYETKRRMANSQIKAHLLKLKEEGRAELGKDGWLSK